MKWSPFCGAFGAATGFLGVAAGAFGAHALRATLAPDLLAAFDTGARYQVVHALALVAVALAFGRGATRALRWAGALFAAGQLLFPGSLYALALSGAHGWGAVTPLGGLCYLGGWLALGIALVREESADR
jgi:uncharacterized membrane protein YgdD (TMEM256/DUF423 family)